MRIIFNGIIFIAFIGSILPVSSLAAESGWNEVGVRAGIQAAPRHEYFHQYEAFGIYGLPWDWRDSSGWGLTPQVNTSLGVLDGGGETSSIGSVGTAIVLNKRGSGLSTDLGINANFLGRRHFGNQDFGSILLFGAYIDIYYCINNKLKIGYRIQHTSNGHIFYPGGTPNPGLDMHMLGASYVY